MPYFTLTYLIIFIFKADFIFSGYQRAGDRDQGAKIGAKICAKTGAENFPTDRNGEINKYK